MQQSPEINKLAAALAKAQGQMDGAKKDSSNPHFKSKYADLSSVWDACRAALSSNGLAVIQMPGECVDGRVAMTTTLTHASGQWMRETLTIPLQKVDAQGYGSATTYARRYALAAFVGIAPEDDDGNAAVSSNGAKNTPAATITQAQFEELSNLAEQAGMDSATLCKAYDINAVAQLPAAKFAGAHKRLQQLAKEKQKEAA